MKLLLKIITQEKQLLEQEVDSVTLPSIEGELTILPMHVPLFTRIKTGEVVFRDQNQEQSVVVTDGFMDVSPNNTVTLMVDSAVRSHEIDILKAEEAKQRAEQMMSEKLEARDFAFAEASLRKAMMEIQTFNRRKNKTSL